MRKNILIIYTGGTIGMVLGEHGYVPDTKYLPRALEAIPELASPEMPRTQLISLPEILDSSDISVSQWNEIGQAVSECYEEFDGFVVLHGTDTMAYSASALSFMLEGLSKPVIFTGSQIPLCELRNDGRDNLINSVMIAAMEQIHEVCLYFGGKLLRGNRSTKASADSFSAFSSPNFLPLAEVGINIQLRESELLPLPEQELRFRPFREVPIGVLKVFPGIQFGLFESIMTEKLKGIVLETFGSGNIPSSGDALLPIIAKAYENGTIITVCSQCERGRVNLGAYAASSKLRQLGAVSGADMTTEAAVTKLYYLFSLGLGKDEIKNLMAKNLRGELTE